MKSERQVILDGLKPMFKKARKEGLWFSCNYQSLWFSPNELEKAHKQGRFAWGAVNWELRDPKERLARYDLIIENAKLDKSKFQDRIKKESGQ